MLVIHLFYSPMIPFTTLKEMFWILYLIMTNNMFRRKFWKSFFFFSFDNKVKKNDLFPRPFPESKFFTALSYNDVLNANDFYVPVFYSMQKKRHKGGGVEVLVRSISKIDKLRLRKSENLLWRRKVMVPRTSDVFPLDITTKRLCNSQCEQQYKCSALGNKY